MGSIISSHNEQILNLSKEYFGCNCRVKDECPLNDKYLTTNIACEAKISNDTNGKSF